MKRILFLTAFIFSFTAIVSAGIHATPANAKKSGSLEQPGAAAFKSERKYIDTDIRTVKKRERSVEGEKRLVNYERNHKIGRAYHLA